MKSSGGIARTMLIVGLTFLYAPIVSMMVFSLNNSRLVTVWDERNQCEVRLLTNQWQFAEEAIQQRDIALNPPMSLRQKFFLAVFLVIGIVIIARHPAPETRLFYA